MSKEIDHNYTDEVVCPYCGAEMADSWEYPDDGKETCWNCGKEFHYQREVEAHYWTHKLNDEGKEIYD